MDPAQPREPEQWSSCPAQRGGRSPAASAQAQAVMVPTGKQSVNHTAEETRCWGPCWGVAQGFRGGTYESRGAK